MTAEIVSFSQEVRRQMEALALRARAAYALMAEATNEQKDMALVQSAMALREHKTGILHANEKDIAFARE